MTILFRTLCLMSLFISTTLITGVKSDEKKQAEKKVTKISDKKTEEKAEAKSDKEKPITPLPEVSIGSQKAPIVVVDYSSLTCNHCAEFHTTILPKIEEKYIKPGLVRFIIRDYPSDQVSLVAHQIAWCRGELKYLDFLKLLYSKQKIWLLEEDPLKALKSVALQNGMSSEQYDTCLKNQEILDKIVQLRLDGQKKYNITATPTIVINAKVYNHALTLEEFEKIVKPLVEANAKKNKKKS